MTVNVPRCPGLFLEDALGRALVAVGVWGWLLERREPSCTGTGGSCWGDGRARHCCDAGGLERHREAVLGN